MQDSSDQTYSGYVAIVGRPNVGKSTLLNHMLRQKISITSRKPQTTRHNLLGIDTQGAHQAVYIDTPGIHARTDKALNRYMVANAKSALVGVDVIVMVLESGQWQAEDEAVLKLVAGHSVPIIGVLSKIDLLKDKTLLLPELQRLAELEVFTEMVPVCALRGEGIEDLRTCVFNYLPAGQHLFGEEEVTDKSERHLVEEIVREKVMRQLGDEIPHAATVVVIKFDAQPALVEIHAEVYVERAGQKSIVIGKDGARLKQIGEQARRDIEVLLDCKVMLHLWVKVRKGWTNDPRAMSRLGYD